MVPVAATPRPKGGAVAIGDQQASLESRQADQPQQQTGEASGSNPLRAVPDAVGAASRLDAQPLVKRRDGPGAVQRRG